MRLLWLIDSLTLGGAESLAATFAIEARRRDVAVTVGVLKTIGGNPIESRLRDAGIDVVHFGSRNLRDIGAFRRVVAAIRDGEFDVIHSHLTYASIWGALASARTGVPHVATLHTLPLKTGAGAANRARQRLLVSLLTRYAARVIAVSDAQRDAWVNTTSLRPDRTVVVPNGVALPDSNARAVQNDDTLFLISAGGERVGVRGDARGDRTGPTVGTIAALREGKGLDVLLTAFSAVRKAMPDATLVIAGDGGLRESLETQAQRLGIAPHWLGYRDDVDTVLAMLDVFVHPTFEDALPTAVLEAMAMGVAVVASATGGVPEIVTHEENGLLVPPGDVDALQTAMLRLLHDPDLRHRLAAAGRRTIEDRFSVDHWIDTLLGVYRDAIGEAV